MTCMHFVREKKNGRGLGASFGLNEVEEVTKDCGEESYPVIERN